MKSILKISLFFGVFISLILIASDIFWYKLVRANFLTNENYYQKSETKTIIFPKEFFLLNKPLTNPPSEIKALYVTPYYISDKKRFNSIIDILKKNRFNALVITLKDSYGHIFWHSNVKLAREVKAQTQPVLDLRKLVHSLHRQNIYLIARLVVFEDSYLAKGRPDLAVKWSNSSKIWSDKKGLMWVDPASKEVWDYTVDLAKEVSKYGFDEINFDYIRFPSDGRIFKISYPVYDGKISKREVIKAFFDYLYQNLSGKNFKLSLDIFGQATVNYDDLGIGQILEDAKDFNFVCPMVYPSHFVSGFLDLKEPAKYPYKIIYYSLSTAKKRLEKIKAKAKIRPWLQAFDLGAVYDKAMIEEEIKAVKDTGLENGFLLWDPTNVYRYLQ